jgi:tetratricopeptide (TPR) repeat protein
MSDALTEVLDAERRAFQDELRRTNLDGRLAAIELTDRAASGSNVAAVPVVVVPTEYLPALLERHLGNEALANAVAQSVELLRPAGRTILLGAALSILEAMLRLRAPIEERLSMAIEATGCLPGTVVPRLRGRCLVNLGTILRDAGSPYDAMIAYEKAADLLGRSGDQVGLAMVVYHRAVVARSSALYEEGLLQLDTAADRLADLNVDLFDGITSERAICTFESGNVVGASSAVDDWILRSAQNTQELSFNKVLPYSMRARIELRRGHVDAALDDLEVAARLAAVAIRQHTTRTFRTSERAQLQPVFAEALRVALGRDRADLAINALLYEKTVIPSRLRPSPLPGIGTLADTAREDLAGATAALARTATGATVSRDVETMRELSERAGDLLDRADVLAAEAGAADVRRSAAQLRGWLLPGELIVEYVTVMGTVWALTTRADGVDCHLVRMLDSDVVLLGGSARAERAARQRPRAADQLGRVLLEPVRDLISEARRLYVILPPPMEAFPLHAVELDGAPLVTHLDVAYLPSVEFLDPRLERSRPDAAARVMAVSNPRYEVLEPLAVAGEDATRVAARLHDADILLDDLATSTALLDALTGGGLLHVTSHAAFEPRAPLLARLLMADRPVFAFEIALARAAAAAVNLSGCSTASQLTSLGGEGEGLAAAFLAAGVPAVVASWWPVEDEVAAAFNDALYASLTSSDAPQDIWTAANAAQRAILEQPEWSHPASWAPFVVLGAPPREGR